MSTPIHKDSKEFSQKFLHDDKNHFGKTSSHSDKSTQTSTPELDELMGKGKKYSSITQINQDFRLDMQEFDLMTALFNRY
jgi:hypothetical protein